MATIYWGDKETKRWLRVFIDAVMRHIGNRNGRNKDEGTFNFKAPTATTQLLISYCTCCTSTIYAVGTRALDPNWKDHSTGDRFWRPWYSNLPSTVVPARKTYLADFLQCQWMLWCCKLRATRQFCENAVRTEGSWRELIGLMYWLVSYLAEVQLPVCCSRAKALASGSGTMFVQYTVLIRTGGTWTVHWLQLSLQKNVLSF